MNLGTTNRVVYIYVLYDTSDESKTVRYVGKTINPARRSSDHRRRTEKTTRNLNNNHRQSWINSVFRNGGDICFSIIEETDEKKWSNREMDCIKKYKEINKLTNTTIGGDGNTLYTISYQECKKWVHKNLPHINSITQWTLNAVNLPNEIPKWPVGVFQNNGWETWSKFLKNGNTQPNLLTKKYIPYIEAKEWIKENLHNIKSVSQWKNSVKLGKIPNFIPNMPFRFYKNKNRGWDGWGDFLGTGLKERSVKSENYLSYDEARKWVHENYPEILNGVDWKNNYVDKNKIPLFITTNPKQFFSYKNQWGGWKKFLKNFIIPHGFDALKKILKNNNIHNVDLYLNFKKTTNDNKIPNFPENTYLKQWKGYDDFFSIKNNKQTHV